MFKQIEGTFVFMIRFDRAMQQHVRVVWDWLKSGEIEDDLGCGSGGWGWGWVRIEGEDEGWVMEGEVGEWVGM